MKILLQPEAKTISNRELLKNQQNLVELMAKLTNFRMFHRAKMKDSSD